MSALPSQTSEPDPGHIAALDGIRGLAILLVMLLHFTDRSGAGDLANRIYTQIADVGWTGVNLFFVLSGFLITGLLLDAQESPYYFRNFYARRTLRIFPLYYVCLLTWLVAIPLVHPPASHYAQNVLVRLHQEQAWYWTYVSNWRMGLNGEWAGLGISVYWSLAVEEQFYLIWPAIVRSQTRRKLSYVCAALIIGALIARAVMISAGANTILVYVSTLARMDALAVGALVAIAFRDPKGWPSARRASRVIGPAAVVALGGIWIAAGQFSEYHPLMQTLGFPILACLFGCAIVHVIGVPDGRAATALSMPALRFFGKYSYAMYLLHLTLGSELVSSERAHAWVLRWGVGAQLGIFVVASAVTVAAAWISWHLLEKHFLALKRYFSTPAIAAL